MIRFRRKKWSDAVVENSPAAADSDALVTNSSSQFLPLDYFKLVFYCLLLIVPIYAIVMSIINRDWLMVVIDILLVPVGFVHGLLLIFGYVS